ncbi:hypothetical protein K491DRAFT_685394 [Lophiostoma macrostomum CBS 122681]|uniref:Uncharacterized protein n=1 Tax=Lophiostoma macrostomum CBS 122681 TaxID=1314788 RepID=A0A6A6SII1_9PLEO|nr:hypothetical protein K491DRAFT_685394 [Lophiostoma macrostomum CBS 122681]
MMRSANALRYVSRNTSQIGRTDLPAKFSRVPLLVYGRNDLSSFDLVSSVCTVFLLHLLVQRIYLYLIRVPKARNAAVRQSSNHNTFFNTTINSIGTRPSDDMKTPLFGEQFARKVCLTSHQQAASPTCCRRADASKKTMRDRRQLTKNTVDSFCMLSGASNLLDRTPDSRFFQAPQEVAVLRETLESGPPTQLILRSTPLPQPSSCGTVSNFFERYDLANLYVSTRINKPVLVAGDE